MKENLETIGYGTYPYKEELLESIPAAYEAGYRLIDTSDNYDNEEFVGQAIKGLDELAVVTKFSLPYRAYNVEDCFKESCQKLGRAPKYYLLHWPYPFLWKIIWRQMEALVEKGEVEYIGVCNFNEKKLKELLNFCKVKPVIDQIERHPLLQQKGIVKACEENQICVMSYSPVARRDEMLVNNEYLLELSQKYGKTVEEIILKWAVSTKGHPIPSSKSKEHLTANINIFDFELEAEEIEKINGLDCNHRIRFNPDTRFTKKEKLLFFAYRFIGYFRDKKK